MTERVACRNEQRGESESGCLTIYETGEVSLKRTTLFDRVCYTAFYNDPYRYIRVYVR